MTADLGLLRCLYRAETFAERGDRLAAQLSELSARPNVDRCDVMIRELAEATTAVHRLRSQLRGEHEQG